MMLVSCNKVKLIHKEIDDPIISIQNRSGRLCLDIES